MGKKTDKLYITATEHSGVYGQHGANSGAHAAAAHDGMRALPFDCCALSLGHWTNPVCVRGEGTIFELTRIIPYLQQYGTNPATGAPLEMKDLVRLKFHKNEEGKWHDPVSFKLFNEHTHIVALEPSGNVFTHDTVQQLNVKAKFMRDLVDDTPFKKSDILTLQDPHALGGPKPLSQMHHIKEGHVVPQPKTAAEAEEVNLSATGGASKLVAQLKAQREEREAKRDGEVAAAPAPASSAAASGGKAKVPYNAGVGSSGMMAASFTSSGMTPQTRSERQTINEEEFMLEQVAAGEGMGARKGKKKGNARAFVRISTNFGPLNVELYCDKAPRTCYNFLTLAARGYYNDTVFHRLIPNFMVQGGDPTGTGRGGESMWGKPFSDELDAPGALRHDQRGSLSMANRGPSTNGSQFFFTFRDKISSLDTKHTVFGRLLAEEGEEGGETTLDRIEKVPTEPGTDRPLRSVRILEVRCLDDPFEAYKAELARVESRGSAEEIARREAKRRRREEDRTTWLGTQLGAKDAAREDALADAAAREKLGAAAGVGKYLGAAPAARGVGVGAGAKRSAEASLPAEPAPGSDKRKKQRGFGDFSAW
ncbi:hypothetical protein FA09DRAFT_327626 [Tilletiopsis washingtonensis]|uniref:Cyclophilin-like protein n=1 Tax=Tilletiopsis washingtonensis TaxID=58919 RepID=A0A316ZGL4_9BASI|nr:hypothetical protein FA09DRAFT_327626 [Tilletiopsis washingtonensis]PWO00911.1 hypothetical protein FA09DRAFT_327626 [Tilletiopsis washingtonensis]